LFLFSIASRPVPRPAHGREVDHLLPYTAEVKNNRPIPLHSVKHRANTSPLSSELTRHFLCVRQQGATRNDSSRSLLLMAVKASSPDTEILLTNGPSLAELLTNILPSVGLKKGCPASNQRGHTALNPTYAPSRYIDTELCPQSIRSIMHKHASKNWTHKVIK
jgi:hypothetical protein